MYTLVRAGKINEYYGTSRDTKPLDVPNGSTWYEFNDQKFFVFDEEKQKWEEQ